MPDKVTSHFGLAQIISGQIDFQGYLANGIADIAAEMIAFLVRASPGALQQMKDVEAQGKHICMRLAALEWMSWKILHNTSSFEMVLAPVQQVLTQSRLAEQLVSDLDEAGHDIIGYLTEGGLQGLKCNICGRARRSTKLDWWRKEPCDPVAILGPLGQVVASLAAPEPLLRGDRAEFGCPGKAEGTWKEVKAEAKAHAIHRREAKLRAKAAEHRATASMAAELAGRRGAAPKQEEVEVAAAPASLVIPGWTRSIHVSHSRELYIAGGLIFCGRCGTTASCCKAGRLQRLCAGEVAKGSQRRLGLLKAGSLKGVAELKAWPSGEPISATVSVFRLPLSSLSS